MRKAILLAAVACAGCISITNSNGESSTTVHVESSESTEESGSSSTGEQSTSSGLGSTTGHAPDTTSGESSSTGEDQDSSTGAAPDACNAPLPAPYESCSQECADPWACDDALGCIYNEPSGDLAHCTTNCATDADCPPSPFPDPWTPFCSIGHCWIDCAYNVPAEDPVCPDGYTCYDQAIPGHRASCMPNEAPH